MKHKGTFTKMVRVYRKDMIYLVCIVRVGLTAYSTCSLAYTSLSSPVAEC